MSQPLNPYAAPTTAYPASIAAGPLLKAPIGTRLVARCLDWLFYSLSLLPGGFLAGLLGEGEPHPAGLLAAAVCFLGLVGFNWLLIHRQGQTLGKRLVGVRVVRQDGSPVRFLRGVVLREWVMLFVGRIPVVGALVVLVNWLMIFAGDRRCLHDLIANTDVVRG